MGDSFHFSYELTSCNNKYADCCHIPSLRFIILWKWSSALHKSWSFSPLRPKASSMVNPRSANTTSPKLRLLRNLVLLCSTALSLVFSPTDRCVYSITPCVAGAGECFWFKVCRMNISKHLITSTQEILCWCPNCPHLTRFSRGKVHKLACLLDFRATWLRWRWWCGRKSIAVLIFR